MFLSALICLLIAFGCNGSPTKRQDGQFTFFDLETPLSGPCDLVEGPDGALWGEAILVNHIFRIDTATGAVEEYPIPFTNPVTGANTSLDIFNDRTESSCAIRQGADGNLYASNGLRNQLVKISPTTKDITVLTPPPYNPLGDLQPFNDLYTAKDGIYLTQTSANLITFFKFADQSFKNYEIPTPASFPLGVYVASNGLVVVAELIGNKIVTLDGNTGELNEYPINEPLQSPAVVRAQTADGLVWYSLFTGNGLGSIDLKTGETKVYHTGEIGALCAENTIDKGGNIWLSFFDINALAEFDPQTKTFSLVNFPDSLSNEPLGLPPYVDVAVNYGPGDAIYFTDVSHNRVGRLALS
ncbi:MAG: hypothetical protein Q9162_000642 [Coniocarpon cinnabarinum]